MHLIIDWMDLDLEQRHRQNTGSHVQYELRMKDRNRPNKDLDHFVWFQQSEKPRTSRPGLVHKGAHQDA